MALTLLESVPYAIGALSFSPVSQLSPVPLVPIETISPKRWRCNSGDHCWHTSEVKARICAFSVLPMVKIQVDTIATIANRLVAENPD